MKTLIVTNYDVSRTVQKVGWFRYHKQHEISMTILTHVPMLSHKVEISGVKFNVLSVTEVMDYSTASFLFQNVLEQIGHSHKQLNKRIFQYTDIIELPSL